MLTVVFVSGICLEKHRQFAYEYSLEYEIDPDTCPPKVPVDSEILLHVITILENAGHVHVAKSLKKSFVDDQYQSERQADRIVSDQK
jgi:hypothetical protein